MRTIANYDLIVVGAGAAGLAASLGFLERSSCGTIAILERSPRQTRGGATRWSGAFLRIDEDRQLDPAWASRVSLVSQGLSDAAYCQKLATETPATVEFIEAYGIEIEFSRFPLAHTFRSGVPSTKSVATPKGGGLVLIETLFGRLEGEGRCSIHYEAVAQRLTISEDGVVDGVLFSNSDGILQCIKAKAVILASGGFEGNYEMLTRYVGPKSCNLRPIAPGVRQNRGEGLSMALEIGADTAGQFDAIHAEPVDRRSAAPDPVIYAFSGGVFVNDRAERFIDEGASTWDNLFEIVGYEIWRRQDQSAYWIGDAKTFTIAGIEAGFLSDIPPVQAESIGELAVLLGLNSSALVETIERYNRAAHDSAFEPDALDGRSTSGIHPCKSNWAVRLDKPPFYGVPLTAAICFTFGGLKTDVNGRVVNTAGRPIPNLYAAGELTGLFYGEYPVATSVLRSLTFGRLAGVDAARLIETSVPS